MLETFVSRSTWVNPIGVTLSMWAQHSRVALTMHYQYIVGMCQCYQRRTCCNMTKQNKKRIVNVSH